MNSHDILGGKLGHAAVGCALYSVHGWAAFNVRMAAFASMKKPDEAQHDKSYLERVGMGPNATRENGTEAPRLVNVEGRIEALVASFLLYAAYLKKPDPETGKVMDVETAKKKLFGIDKVEKFAANYAVGNNKRIATIKRNGAELKKPQEKIDAAVKLVEDEERAKFHTAFEPFRKHFDKTFDAYLSKDDGELIDVIEDVMTNEGVKPVAYIKEGAMRLVDSFSERFDQGKTDTLDAGILALSRLTA